jgi:hypothetical protein
MEIGFIGLGAMGAPMARNLAAAGHRVTGFDPAGVAVEGVAPAASAAEAAGAGEAVVTMLPDGAILRAVYAEVAPAARPGALLVDCSTVDVASARAAAAAAEAAGLRAVDAPVSGGTKGAAAGTLTFMVGGRCGRIRPRSPAARDDGLARRPLRRERGGPGGEDLQQHDPRGLDDRGLRGLRAGRQARAAGAGAVRRGFDLLGLLLVGERLLPRFRAWGPRRRRTTATVRASRRS